MTSSRGGRDRVLNGRVPLRPFFRWHAIIKRIVGPFILFGTLIAVLVS